MDDPEVAALVQQANAKHSQGVPGYGTAFSGSTPRCGLIGVCLGYTSKGLLRVHEFTFDTSVRDLEKGAPPSQVLRGIGVKSPYECGWKKTQNGGFGWF